MEMQGCPRMEVVENKYKVIEHYYCIKGGCGGALGAPLIKKI